MHQSTAFVQKIMSTTKPQTAVDVEKDPLIVIASNRGPFSFSRDENGDFSVRRGEGGLVTALWALAQQNKVLWIAAALSDDDRAWAAQHANKITEFSGIFLKLITPDREQYDLYYNEISNPLLWFIHHELWDVPRSPVITRRVWEAWDAYRAVNEQFAEVIAESVEEMSQDDEDRPIIVFPQDYHLYMVPYFLRKRVGDRVQIQPFIHIPWPGPDAWRLFPEKMRTAIIKSLLSSDRIGFQTKRDAFNFVQTARFHLNDAHSYGARDSITYQERKVAARAYPISVDVEKVQAIAEEPQTQLLKNQLLQTVGDGKLILRVDRVEPSKNILRGLQAYRTLLEEHPEHRGKVVMMALLVPSRMEVEHYQSYLKEIMAEAGMINADFATEFWEPVRTILGNNYHRAIAAMQLYDVLLVNPIADGMNLVAKEGALVNQRNGVLLLSEYAGAFYEMGEYALSITPVDVYGTAEAMHHALTMDMAERAERAEKLREIVANSGVTYWFHRQVADAMHALRATYRTSPEEQ